MKLYMTLRAPGHRPYPVTLILIALFVFSFGTSVKADVALDAEYSKIF